MIHLSGHFSDGAISLGDEFTKPEILEQRHPARSQLHARSLAAIE
jgi:hypothetical protein